MIEDKKYLFNAFYLDDNPVYEKYFFLQRKDNKYKEEIYFVLQSDDTGEVLLLIEIRDIISVNYIHKYISSPMLPFKIESLMTLLSSIAHYFSINQVIIHDEYKSYDEISSKLLQSKFTTDTDIVSLYSGDFKYYNKTLISYLEKKERPFNFPGITFSLRNHHLNKLRAINALDIFIDTEKSALYNIVLKNKSMKLIEFYLYIHNNYFYYITELDRLISTYDTDIFTNLHTSPWINSNIVLNSEEYLYNKGYIQSIQSFKTNVFKDYLIKLGEEYKTLSFNNFRLGLL